MRSQVHTTRYPVWLLWLVGIPVAIAAIALAVFFLTFMLIIFGIAIAVFALRIWWLRRRLRHTLRSGVIEGEYVVVKEETGSPRANKNFNE